MNHPYDLLADFVDGTLDAGDRARVDAHLGVCASCHEDVRAAEEGRAAARSLPRAVAPSDLHDRVAAEAGGGGDAAGLRGAPRWYRWAGVAAAAAVVVAIAIALPNIGGDGDRERVAEDSGGAGAAESAEVTSGVEVPLEMQDEDYDAQDLERLARDPEAGRAAALATDPESGGSPAAFRCVTMAFAGQPDGRLARLIQARFEGRQAYLAVYLEGPGAGQPPDTGAVWVAARDECTILSFAQARL
jgi:hypothetical protein